VAAPHTAQVPETILGTSTEARQTDPGKPTENRDIGQL